MTKQLIEICTLFFTQQELQQLLARDPALWARAVKRGKGVRRAEAMEAREAKERGR